MLLEDRSMVSSDEMGGAVIGEARKGALGVDKV